MRPDRRNANAPTGNPTSTSGCVYPLYRLGKQWQPGVRFDRLRSDGWRSGTATADPTAAQKTATDTYSAWIHDQLGEAGRLRFQTNYVTLSPSVRDWQFLLQ